MEFGGLEVEDLVDVEGWMFSEELFELLVELVFELVGLGCLLLGGQRIVVRLHNEYDLSFYY